MNGSSRAKCHLVAIMGRVATASGAKTRAAQPKAKARIPTP